MLDGKGTLDDYSVLFLPGAPYMSQELSRRLRAWVQQGGTLVALGPCALKDECGLDLAREDSIYKTLFPKFKQIGAGRWDYSVEGAAQRTQPLTTSDFGKGRVVCLNRTLTVVMQDASLRALLTEIVQDVCERTATSPSSDLEILVREGKDGEKYLGLCNKNVEKPIETIVTVAGKYENPMDLLVPGWCPVPAHIYGHKTILRIRLEPGDWTLLRL